MESASLEERKEFIGAFITGVTVRPDEARLDVTVSRIPCLARDSSVGVVAGARDEPLQTRLRPLGTRRSTEDLLSASAYGHVVVRGDPLLRVPSVPMPHAFSPRETYQ